MQVADSLVERDMVAWVVPAVNEPDGLAPDLVGAVVSGVACTAYDPVILAAQQFLDVPVMASHLEVYEPVVRPVQLNTALFPE